MLIDDTTFKNKWPFRRVIITLTDSKNLVRSVLIKTAHSELKRPICKLCLLVAFTTAYLHAKKAGYILVYLCLLCYLCLEFCCCA